MLQVDFYRILLYHPSMGVMRETLEQTEEKLAAYFAKWKPPAKEDRKTTAQLLEEVGKVDHPTQELFMKATGERQLPTCVHNDGRRAETILYGRTVNLEAIAPRDDTPASPGETE